MASRLFYIEGYEHLNQLELLRDLFWQTELPENLAAPKSVFRVGPILTGFNGRTVGAEFLISSADVRNENIENKIVSFNVSKDLFDFCEKLFGRNKFKGVLVR